MRKSFAKCVNFFLINLFEYDSYHKASIGFRIKLGSLYEVFGDEIREEILRRRFQIVPIVEEEWKGQCLLLSLEIEGKP